MKRKAVGEVMGKVQRLANHERSAGVVLAGQGHAQTGAEAMYTLPGVFVQPCLLRTNSSPCPGLYRARMKLLDHSAFFAPVDCKTL